MPALATRPLLAVSLFVPSIILLAYLWQKRRAEESDADQKFGVDPTLGPIDSKVVSLKLESLNRSRLDCIEEEERNEEVCEEKKKVPELKESPAPEPVAASKETELIDEIERLAIVNRERLSRDESKDFPVVHESKTEESTCETAIVSEVVVEELVPSDRVVITNPVPSPPTESQVTNMTEKTVAEVTKESVPDVFTALKDPILSTSPVKSESSDSQRSSEAWSDLIEQDERDMAQVISDKVSNLDLCSGESVRHDSGVASPTDDYSRQDNIRKEADEKSRISTGEDAGIGSETGESSDFGPVEVSGIEDTQLLAYHFYIQDYLCGTFIGREGFSINKLKTTCNCNIILKDDNKATSQKKVKVKSRDRKYGEGKLNLCIIEGTRANIDKCLDMIKERFCKHPELTLEQINKSENTNLSFYNGSVSLSLAEGIMHDVFVSSIVNGGHVFVQQPAHPTFPALERLDSCMYNTYSQFSCPELSRPILPNSVCVASNNGCWYRCQVVSYDEIEDVCDIKYLDYGGYDTIQADQLRQIRTDFLSLPFQAIECHLANIMLTEEDTVSGSILEELVAGQVVQARMIGFNEEGVPMVHLYRACNGQTVMVNRELVDRSCGNWIEATIVPFSPRD